MDSRMPGLILQLIHAHIPKFLSHAVNESAKTMKASCFALGLVEEALQTSTRTQLSLSAENGVLQVKQMQKA